MQGDGLVQPLPGLVQRVDAVPNTHTIARTLNGHSFQLARREKETFSTGCQCNRGGTTKGRGFLWLLLLLLPWLTIVKRQKDRLLHNESSSMAFVET
uniref:Uncharacterized protein n=1 Tax=Anopheles marajoara TaxID=58244 RepID=A0A2M4C4G8_9DIPT